MAESDAIRAEVDALVALVDARHGARLDDEQRADLARLVASLVEMARALRAVSLSPADEPYPPFAPWRPPP